MKAVTCEQRRIENFRTSASRGCRIPVEKVVSAGC